MNLVVPLVGLLGPELEIESERVIFKLSKFMSAWSFKGNTSSLVCESRCSPLRADPRCWPLRAEPRCRPLRSVRLATTGGSKNGGGRGTGCKDCKDASGSRDVSG